MSAWKPGPDHPDYGYDGEYGYPKLAPGPASDKPPRRRTYAPVSDETTGKVGPIMHRRFTLTPEGAGACASPAAPAPSGHIYRSVTLMTPVQAAEIMDTTWRLGVRGSVVTRDGRGREEATAS